MVFTAFIPSYYFQSNPISFQPRVFFLSLFYHDTKRGPVNVFIALAIYNPAKRMFYISIRGGRDLFHLV